MAEDQKNTRPRPLTHRRMVAASLASKQEAELTPDASQYVPEEYRQDPTPIYPPQAMQSLQAEISLPPSQPEPAAPEAEPEAALPDSVAEIAPTVTTVDSILSREGETYSQLVGLLDSKEEESLPAPEAPAEASSGEPAPDPFTVVDAKDVPEEEAAKAEEIPHMNTAPPYHATPASEMPDIIPSFGPPREIDDDDFGDTDSTRFTPVSIQPVPAPVPVPAAPMVPEARRHSGFVLFFLTLTLLVSLGMAYFSGIADGLLAQLGIPSWKQVFAGMDGIANSVPDIFSAGTDQPGGNPSLTEAARGQSTPAMVSAQQTVLTKLKAFTVTPSSTTAPATLIFSIFSDENVTNIKLAKDNGEILFAEGRGAPSGDGMLWQFTVEFIEPYEGPVHAYLRSSESTWSSSGDSIHVSVQ